MSHSIGFLGIGAMGWQMAARLADAHEALSIYDVAQMRTANFAQQYGAAIAETPAQLAGCCDVIITMLPNSAIVEEALSGNNGILGTLRTGTTLIEMSSGLPAASQRFAAMVAHAGGRMIDAPVSGGVQRAQTGDLAIMVGGDADVIDEVEPILRIMGSSIMRTGAVGSAHAMKALNNLVSAAGFLIGIEALLVGKKFGLAPEAMVDVLNASSGVNNSTQRKFKQFVLSRSFDAGFGLDLMVKDLSIAIKLAHDTGTAVPFATLCREHWAAAAGMLGAGRDHTEVTRYSEAIAGIEL
jgi:3-hydroxyisobutyrate dehydrogenase